VGLRIEIPMDAAVRLFQAFEIAAEPTLPEVNEPAELISIPAPISTKEAASGPKADQPAPAVAPVAAPAIVIGAMTLGATYRRNLDRRNRDRGRSQKRPSGVK
jgi:hypothetical protein